MNRFCNIRMLCRHTGKHDSTIRRALKAAAIPTERLPSCQGVRIREEDANRFVLTYYPEVGPIAANPNNPD